MPGHAKGDDAQLLRGLTATYWRVPAFWAESFPMLLVPAGVLRRWRALAERVERPMRPFAPADLKGRVTTELPAVVGAGHDLHLSCEVENLGPLALRHTLPHPVRVGARWVDENGHELPVAERWALRPGGSSRASPGAWTSSCAHPGTRASTPSLSGSSRTSSPGTTSSTRRRRRLVPCASSTATTRR